MKRDIQTVVLPDSVRNSIEWVVTFANRRAARRKYAQTKRQRDGAISSIRNLIQKSDIGFEHSRVIHNVSLYALLIDQDLSQLMTDMVCAIGDDRRRYVARNLAVLLYEASTDLAELTGGQFRKSLSKLKIPPEWLVELNEVSRDLNSFKNKHRDFLVQIRNMVSAHRDKNAISQYELMNSLEPLEIVRLGPEFQNGVSKLVNLQIKLTAHVGRLDILALDITDSSRGHQ